MPITQDELGRRIRQAREACGRTQEEVASDLGIPRSAVALIESGGRRVSSLELERVAFLFGRDMKSLLAEEFTATEDTLAALFRRHPEVKDQAEVVAALQTCLRLGREITNLETQLELDRTTAPAAMYPMRDPKTRWDAIQQGERAAVEERRRLGLGDAPVPVMAEVLEGQGVRTAVVNLPEEVSGLTLSDPAIGPFVVVNGTHIRSRRRFSYAHEYAHVLLDRSAHGTVSRTADRESLTEVRANAFAAAFLMPEGGLRAFVAALGKGRDSRSQTDVWAEGGNPVQVRVRTAPASQDIQMYDVVQIAHHFLASVPSVIFRLKNLGIVDKPEFEKLLTDEPKAPAIARVLRIRLADEDRRAARNEFVHRLLGLGMEAYRRDLITRAKLFELAGLLEVPTHDLDEVLREAGLEGDEADVLVPEL